MTDLRKTVSIRSRKNGLVIENETQKSDDEDGEGDSKADSAAMAASVPSTRDKVESIDDSFCAIEQELSCLKAKNDLFECDNITNKQAGENQELTNQCVEVMQALIELRRSE